MTKKHRVSLLPSAVTSALPSAFAAISLSALAWLAAGCGSSTPATSVVTNAPVATTAPGVGTTGTSGSTGGSNSGTDTGQGANSGTTAPSGATVVTTGTLRHVDSYGTSQTQPYSMSFIPGTNPAGSYPSQVFVALRFDSDGPIGGLHFRSPLNFSSYDGLHSFYITNLLQMPYLSGHYLAFQFSLYASGTWNDPIRNLIFDAAHSILTIQDCGTNSHAFFCSNASTEASFARDFSSH